MLNVKNIFLVLLCLILFNLRSQTFSDSLEQKILSAQQNGRIVENFNTEFKNNPKGDFLILPENKDIRYAVIIYNIDIFKEKATFSAGLAFRDPKSNQLIAFKAENVNFSKTKGISGPVKLYLIENVKSNLGQAVDIEFLSGIENSYVQFECIGITEFSISGNVYFNSDFILPVNKNGEIEYNRKLESSFQFKAKSWNDFILQISLKPFQIKGFKDYVFTVNNATLDLSESLNATSMIFPKQYNENELLGGNIKMWEGFYLQTVSVLFPPHFKSDNKERISLGVNNMLIDEFGFSGNIFGNNLLSFEKGSLGSWNFSIDKADLNIIMNEIVSAKLTGNIGMPILPDSSKLIYEAYVNVDDNYGMIVSTNNNLTIPAFKVGKLILYQNSYVNIDIIEGDINLTAELNGKFFIENKAKDNHQFKFPIIEFQGLHVSNKAPKFDLKYLGITNQSDSVHFSKYPINIYSLKFFKVNNNNRLQILFGLNLTEKIALKAGVELEATFNSENNKDKLKFSKVNLSELLLYAKISNFTLEGSIKFIKEDLNFGNGLNGTIKFNMEKPSGINAEATVLFGNIKGHRYWYFDAGVLFDKGIPFFPGAEINGFVGGAWQGMRELKTTDSIINPQLGKTVSGKFFVPDKASGMGFKAGLYFQSTGGSSTSKPYMAKVILEIQFSQSFGLNRLSIFGNIDIMTNNISKSKTDLVSNTNEIPSSNAWKNYSSNFVPKGKISGPFMLNLDFTNNEYMGACAVYINGIANDKIKGSGKNGLAGEIMAFYSKSKWYCYVGTPKQPINVIMDFSVSKLNLQSYFMAGTNVLPAEPLPYEITNILGNKNADAMRKLNEMATGNAFAFGARLKLEIKGGGGNGAVSLQASLLAIAGFDINVANYGKANCEGRAGTIGVNGWFANGQLFIYVRGKITAKYDLKGIKGGVDLAELTFATNVNAQGPNPFYASGSAAVEVKILNIFNEKLNLNFELGEQCKIIKDKFSDTIIILETYPLNNEPKFSVLDIPKIKFSIPINQTFYDIDKKEVKFVIKEIKLKDNIRNYAPTYKWDEKNLNLDLLLDEMLEGQKNYKLSVLIEAQIPHYEFKVYNKNGGNVVIPNRDKNLYLFNQMKMNEANINEFIMPNGNIIKRTNKSVPYLLNNKSVSEFKEINFTTAKSLSNIPLSNIENAYPIPSNINYFTGVSNNGFINLKTNQSNLVNIPNTKIIAQFIDQKGNIIEEVIVKYANKNFNFKIPNNLLKKNEAYQINLLLVSINSPSEKGKNINSANALVSPNLLANKAMLANSTTNSNTSNNSLNKISNNNNTPKPPTLIRNMLFSYAFGVSAFDNILDKLSHLKPTKVENLKGFSGGNILNFTVQNKNDEYFDKIDIYAKEKSSIKFQIANQANTWFNSESKKLYSIFQSKELNILNNLSLNRDTSLLGLIPTKSINIIENSLDKYAISFSKYGFNVFKPSYSEKEIYIENFAHEQLKSDLEDIKLSLIKYITSNTNINTTVLNQYCNSLTPTVNTNIVNIKTSNFNSVSTINNTSLNAFAQTNVVSQNNNVVYINPTSPPANNAWLIKINKLKISDIVSGNYPLVFYYFLPNEKKPINTAILNLNFTQK